MVKNLNLLQKQTLGATPRPAIDTVVQMCEAWTLAIN